jgi:NADP-dependent 3-hydroxy acid dehydrogenase YdfG
MSLTGKTALITGSSRGIGAAVARRLDAEGVNLALASRSGDDLGLEGAVARPCDVRRPDDLEAIVAAAVERFGGLDIVVANAGVGAYGPFLDLSLEYLDEMVDVNVCPGGVATDFALEEGRGRTPDVLPGMMTAEDVADVVLFVLTRPRSHRILETAFRPMREQSWGLRGSKR